MRETFPYFMPQTDYIAERLVVARNKVSKWQLFNSLCSSSMKPIHVEINGIMCSVQSITKEDGGGSSFNMMVQHKGINYPCHCRTID